MMRNFVILFSSFDHLESIRCDNLLILSHFSFFVFVSSSLCGIVPGLSSVLLPRMNPFVLINMAGALSLCITYMLIEIK